MDPGIRRDDGCFNQSEERVRLFGPGGLQRFVEKGDGSFPRELGGGRVIARGRGVVVEGVVDIRIGEGADVDASIFERVDPCRRGGVHPFIERSEEHTSELQSLMRISYAVFCLKKKNNTSHVETTL